MEPPQNDSTTPVVTQTQSKKRSRAETDAPEPEDLAVPFTLPPIREILSAEPRLSPERVHQQQLTRDANSSRAPSLEPSNSTTGPPSVTGNESTTTLSSSETDTAYYSESLPSLSTGAHRSISPAHVFSSMSGHPDSLAEATDDDGEYETDLEEQAAVAQAEEGSIIVDSDDLSSDGGYGTDTGSTGSTSLAESMRDFIYENGRRYHRFREGRYNFPNDDVEQQREDMKHTMVKMLCGQLYFAPIGQHPHEILDIGTGTGVWAIEMGDLFPSANILGVDLSPIQPDWVPPNVRFMVDDVESPWLHPRNYFDYIHSRHTVMAIKDWPRLMRRALEHLRPGGWFEMQEVHHYPYSANKTMPPTNPITQYWSLINDGLSNLGINFHAASGGRLAAMMRDCGFVNVSERVLQIPIGTWARNRVLKTVGLYWRTILTDGIQAIALGPLTRGCGWSREQVELFLVEVRKAYRDNSLCVYMELHLVYGQKPEGY